MTESRKQVVAKQAPATLGELFISFVRIGTFMFGGGYAMYPLLEREVVERRNWLTNEEMSDVFALSQVIPGLIGINSAMLTGHKQRGWQGALAAVFGMLAVPFLVILVIANIFDAILGNIWTERFVEGLRPAVAGLLMGTAIKLVHKSWKQAWSVIVGVAVLMLGLVFKISPVYVILGSIALGLCWHLAIVSRSSKVAR